MVANTPFCPACGARNEADAIFCEECGQGLGGASAAPPAAPSGKRRRLLLWLGIPALVLALAIGGAFAAGDEIASAAGDRALAMVKEGKYEQALSATDWLGRFDAGHNLRVHQARGRAYAFLGRHDEALREFEAAALMTSEDAYKLFAVVGRQLEQKDDVEAALLYYEEAVKWKPDEAGRLVDRARARAKLGQYEDALADAEAALALEPDNAAALKARQAILPRIGGQRALMPEAHQSVFRRP